MVMRVSGVVPVALLHAVRAINIPKKAKKAVIPNDLNLLLIKTPSLKKVSDTLFDCYTVSRTVCSSGKIYIYSVFPVTGFEG